MSKNDIVKSANENDVKYYVLVKTGYKHYDPHYVSVGMTTVLFIFPVSESNAIGTLDVESNGIVFIKFGGYGEELESKVIAHDFSELVIGAPFKYRFCPNVSDDTIAYSTGRLVVVANAKTGEAFQVECGLSEQDFMLGICFLNIQTNLCVIVKSIRESKKGWEDYLHIVKLKGQRFVDTGWSMHIGNDESSYITSTFPLYHTWFVHDRKLFVYDHGKILCTDGSQPTTHPFFEVFNANAERIGNIKDIAVHPTLPFGVMIENRASDSILHQLKVVYWEVKKPRKQIVVFSNIFESLVSRFGLERMALAYQSFSPDGNWYVVGCISPKDAEDAYNLPNPFFIVIPIDQRCPHFLVVRDLVVLGQVKGMTSLAWVTGSATYVVSNGEVLHKWDLDELAAATVFVMPEGDGVKKKGKSIFKRIRGLFGSGG